MIDSSKRNCSSMSVLDAWGLLVENNSWIPDFLVGDHPDAVRANYIIDAFVKMLSSTDGMVFVKTFNKFDNSLIFESMGDASLAAWAVVNKRVLWCHRGNTTVGVRPINCLVPNSNHQACSVFDATNCGDVTIDDVNLVERLVVWFASEDAVSLRKVVGGNTSVGGSGTNRMVTN